MIVTSNLIISPPLMWKKAKILWGMGIENSQVLVIGSGRVDRFVRQFLVSNVEVQILRSDKCRVHNLLKLSMCDRLDQGEGYTSCVGGFTSREIRLISLIRPDLIQSIFWIP